jgi:hypothetical protein
MSGNGGLIGYFFSRLLGKYFKVLENILNLLLIVEARKWKSVKFLYSN